MRTARRRFTVDLSKAGFGSVENNILTTFKTLKMNKDLENRRLRTCKSFVPRRVIRHLTDIVEGRKENGNHVAEFMQGAVLFADVSGFTALAESLKRDYQLAAERGEIPEWTPPERLCQKLNAFLTEVIDNVHLYGGDVIKFSGDAITVLFIGDRKAAERTGGYICPDLATATLRAAQCSEMIHQKTKRFEPELTMHMGIGAGSLTGVFVGGAFGRMEYVNVSHFPVERKNVTLPLFLQNNRSQPSTPTQPNQPTHESNIERSLMPPETPKKWQVYSGRRSDEASGHCGAHCRLRGDWDFTRRVRANQALLNRQACEGP
jgi:class 3 adenylate cyclase